MGESQARDLLLIPAIFYIIYFEPRVLPSLSRGAIVNRTYYYGGP